MKLKELLKSLEILDSKNLKEDLEISTVEYHTDKVKKDSLFVAIKGYKTDGHKYIKKALKKGAVAIVVEDFQDIEAPQIKVKNSRIALAKIASNFYGDPSKELNIVGVTATNGKTTTAFMIESIFKEANFKTGISGTVYTKYADTIIPSILTTPESKDLQFYFRDMVEKGIEKVVMEVSSSADELHRVDNVDFDIVTFNNLSREHIDQHGSFERYYEVKSRLIRFAPEHAIAILNMDFDLIGVLKEKTRAKVLTYSLKEENYEYDFSIGNLDLSSGMGKFTFYVNRDIKLKDFTIKKQKFEIDLNVAGYSSVMNAVVAIIVGLVNRIDIKIIIKGLENFKGVERRFEMIYDEKFKIIDDHFANVRNIDVSLETLSKMKYKNLHFLYAIRGNRGVHLNEENAEKIVEWFKILKPKNFYASLSKETVTWKDEVSKEELEVFEKVMKKNNINFKLFENLEESVISILKCAKEDDLVFLGGCQGMDKGAKYALNYIIDSGLTKKADELKEKINSRIC